MIKSITFYTSHVIDADSSVTESRRQELAIANTKAMRELDTALNDGYQKFTQYEVHTSAHTEVVIILYKLHKKSFEDNAMNPDELNALLTKIITLLGDAANKTDKPVNASITLSIYISVDGETTIATNQDDE